MDVSVLKCLNLAESSGVDADKLGFTSKNEGNSVCSNSESRKPWVTVAKMDIGVCSTLALEFNKVHSRWVPKHLTDQLKQNISQSAKNTCNDSMKEAYVACDETWVHYISLQANTKPFSGNTQAQPSAEKLTRTVFWDF
jgi:hypothetical protein